MKSTGGKVVGKPAYAATFAFRASSDAAGTFDITSEKGPAASMLTDSEARELTFESGKLAKITVGTPKRTKTDR